MRGRFGMSRIDSAIKTYLREVAAFAPVSAAEEKLLIHQVLHGDTEARDQLIRAKLRLVADIARDNIGKGLTLADLIEEGNRGLLHAVENLVVLDDIPFDVPATRAITRSIERAVHVCIGRTTP